MSWKNKLKKNEEMFGWGQEDGSETDYSEEREAMQASHDKSHSELKQVLNESMDDLKGEFNKLLKLIVEFNIHGGFIEDKLWEDMDDITSYISKLNRGIEKTYLSR